MTNEQIARVAHEVNRAYCQALGDNSQPKWEDAPDWQRQSAMTGVKLHTDNPDAGPEASHESWMREKKEGGWVYGPVKDPAAKQHPCMVPFAELPREQQAKDFIFRAVVHALVHKDATPPPIDRSVSGQIQCVKTLRRDTNDITQRVKSMAGSRERALAITKLQEATMWLGMDLKRIGEENPGFVPNPYPNSKDPSTTVIDKTADGLKL